MKNLYQFTSGTNSKFLFQETKQPTTTELPSSARELVKQTIADIDGDGKLTKQEKKLFREAFRKMRTEGEVKEWRQKLHEIRKNREKKDVSNELGALKQEILAKNPELKVTMTEEPNKETKKEGKEVPPEMLPASKLLEKSPAELQKLFLEEKDGNQIVNFHGNLSAQAYIGVAHMFEYDPAKGTNKYLEVDGIVGMRGLCEKGPMKGRPGYITESGQYLMVTGGEKIKQISEPKAYDEKFKERKVLTLEDDKKNQTAYLEDIKTDEKDEYAIDNGENLKGNALLNHPPFRQKLEQVCKNLGVNVEDMITVMRAESGINPKARNANGGATGLIQFIPGTARGLGTTTRELRKMSGVAQLDYVQKYFEPYRDNLGSAKDLYLVTFYPTALAHKNEPNYKIGDESVALANPVIAHGKNQITMADFNDYVEKKQRA